MTKGFNGTTADTVSILDRTHGACLSESWTICAGLEEEIVDVARKGYPEEQCGLLVGRFDERLICGQIGMTNIEHSECHFLMDPREQFRAARSVRGSGTEIVGYWHSHPYTPARLSDEDLRFSRDESALYAVVSLQDPMRPRLNIWKVSERGIRPVPLVLASADFLI